MLAEMNVDVELAQTYTYYAASLKDKKAIACQKKLLPQSYLLLKRRTALFKKRFKFTVAMDI